MKNTLILFGVFAMLFALVSCENDTTGDISRVTYFADFVVDGDGLILMECGQTYDDPGVSATENGTEVEVETDASGTYFGAGTVDGNSPDQYNISYTATNSDGFSGGVSRQVYVACTGDLETSLEGLYTSSVRRGGEDQSAQYADMSYVIIKSAGGDNYELTSALGGYYDIGRVYGPDYAARGATINFSGGTATPVSEGVFPVWGNIVTLSDISVDAAAKTITYHGSGNFGNGEFDIVLKQVNF